MSKSIKIDFNELLQVREPWRVVGVSFDGNSRVDIELEYTSKVGKCSECGTEGKVYDSRETRSWRHLDIMQYQTYLHCRIPRIDCGSCNKVLSVKVPWAESRNGYTLLFENHAIDILQAARSVEEARKLLGINWHQLNGIKERAVSRGLLARSAVNIVSIGIDEKSYAKGHQYASILSDLDNSRVLDLVSGRRQQDAESLIKQALNSEQRESVKAAAIDMSKSFQNAIESTLPEAKIVHDVFHIAKHLNEAVDKTRRWENKMLLRDSNKSLQGLRFEFLRNSENVDLEITDMFKTLERAGYKTAEAWQYKELFRHFWRYTSRAWARKFFKKWYYRVVTSDLRHLKKVAVMLKKRINNVLNYFNHRITNAKAEGFNSKIQTVQSNSRGFRSFQNLRIAVLFYCGKLQLKHQSSH